MSKVEPIKNTWDIARRYLLLILTVVVGIVSVGLLGYSIISLFDTTIEFNLDFVAISIAGLALTLTIFELDRTQRSEKLAATLEIITKLGSEDFRRARDMVNNETIDWDIPSKASDGEPYENKLKIRQLMSLMNQTGFLMKRGLIDKWMVLDLYHLPIIKLWDALEDDLINKNQSGDKPYPYYMVHFKYLKEESEDWISRHNLEIPR
ncbi:MAG: hypothetical protein ACFFFK_12795 [Candidatus Thorarchaeota archaeon]